MSEFNAYDPPNPPRPNSTLAPAYKFSPEELRVLGDCNRESFYARSLPLSTLLGLGAYAAVNKGYWKGSSRFGAIPKVSIAVIIGYFVGKVSYQQKCAEKLMNLPGSHIGQILRERREGKGSFSTRSQNYPPMLGANPEEVYSDAGPGNSLDFDTDRPAYDNDTYRPDSVPTLEDPATRPPLSYDDLRKSHREQFATSRGDPYKVLPQNAPIRPPPEAPVRPIAPKSTNKYGDDME